MKNNHSIKMISSWDSMPDEVRKGVERGIDQSKKGAGRTHDEVMKKYSKLLKNKSKFVKPIL
ncbi:MAG: hypothetical protein HY840_05785 [Bacteroidetes bacterium]|nr:hypothetical protein [Bacteroidota bacterium]